MSDFKEGDKVRVTFVGEVVFVDGGYVEVASGADVIPLSLADERVTVVPAGEPDRFERALTVLADNVAGLRAAENRCRVLNEDSRAKELMVQADAIRDAMVGVVRGHLVASGTRSAEALAEAIKQADHLIGEAEAAAAVRLARICADLEAARDAHEAEAVASDG